MAWATAELKDVTFSLDTNAYADGDVLADTQEITNAVRGTGGPAVLESVVVVDADDQGKAFDLVFFAANQSLGTENAASDLSDAEALDLLGFVKVAAADYIDLGGVRVATLRNLGLILKAGSDSRSLYVGAIIREAGTYSASGLKVRFGFRW